MLQSLFSATRLMGNRHLSGQIWADTKEAAPSAVSNKNSQFLCQGLLPCRQRCHPRAGVTPLMASVPISQKASSSSLYPDTPYNYIAWLKEGAASFHSKYLFCCAASASVYYPVITKECLKAFLNL